MDRNKTCCLVFFMVAVLMFAPLAGTASAQEEIEEEAKSAGEMAFDVVLVRPAGILATLLGSAAFVISLPFSAMGGDIDSAYEKMIVAPAAYTFERPLGSF